MRASPIAQLLEHRRLLAVTLTLEGTEGDDHIAVAVEGANVVTNVNGTVTSTPDVDVQDILINGRGGADLLVVESNGNNVVTVNGGAGDDDVRLAPTSGRMDRITAFVMVNGDAGSDRLALDDRNAPTSVTYEVNAPVIARSNGAFILPRAELLVLTTGAGNDAISIGNHRTVLDAGGGTDTITVVENGATGSTTVLGSAGEDRLFVNSDGFGIANVTLVAQRLDSLRVGNGGRVTLEASASSSALATHVLDVAPGAVLDVRDNAIIVDYSGASPIDNVVGLLTSGYNGGAWNGAGINSSTAAGTTTHALGYAEATDLFTAFPATFAGEPVDATAVLIAHTRYGDADLSGHVDLDDFNRLAAHFGAQTARWSHGDFDFDRDVDLDDFNRLAANFGGTARAGGHVVEDDECAERLRTEIS